MAACKCSSLGTRWTAPSFVEPASSAARARASHLCGQMLSRHCTLPCESRNTTTCLPSISRLYGLPGFTALEGAASKRAGGTGGAVSQGPRPKASAARQLGSSTSDAVSSTSGGTAVLHACPSPCTDPLSCQHRIPHTSRPCRACFHAPPSARRLTYGIPAVGQVAVALHQLLLALEAAQRGSLGVPSTRSQALR